MKCRRLCDIRYSCRKRTVFSHGILSVLLVIGDRINNLLLHNTIFRPSHKNTIPEITIAMRETWKLSYIILVSYEKTPFPYCSS